MLSLVVLMLVLAVLPTSLALLLARERDAPKRMPRPFIAAAVVGLILVELLSIPFDRWLIATVSCGHQPIETNDLAASNSYTLPSDGTYSRYPIFDGFACNLKDVRGRQHDELPGL